MLHCPRTINPATACIVVVPARNEEQRILACLDAIYRQHDQEGQPLRRQTLTVLVINCTTDLTKPLVLAWLDQHRDFACIVLEVNPPGQLATVGRARRLGFGLAARIFDQIGKPEGLLFSTDADSRLAPNALCRSLIELRHVDAFGTLILPGEEDTSQIGALFCRYNELKAKLRYRYFRLPYERHPQHGNFGGAGFGVRSAWYARVGGLPPLAYDEDKEFERSLLLAGARISYPDDIIVYTSTRTIGRTPWGMARQLLAWEEDLACKRMPCVDTAAALQYTYQQKAAFYAKWLAGARREPFERQWTAWWNTPTAITRRRAYAEQVPLPVAVEQLSRLLATLPSSPLKHVQPVAGMFPVRHVQKPGGRTST